MKPPSPRSTGAGRFVVPIAYVLLLSVADPRWSLAHYQRISPSPSTWVTTFSSTLGMTHILLPYMILALFAVMQWIDPNHLKAAASLGARPRVAFLEVFLPLSLPGVVNGSLLVFVTCLGFFVTPVLLGTPRDMMISQLINQQIEELLAWGFASALAVVLLAAVVGLRRRPCPR